MLLLLVRYFGFDELLDVARRSKTRRHHHHCSTSRSPRCLAQLSPPSPTTAETLSTKHQTPNTKYIDVHNNSIVKYSMNIVVVHVLYTTTKQCAIVYYYFNKTTTRKLTKKGNEANYNFRACRHFDKVSGQRHLDFSDHTPQPHKKRKLLLWPHSNNTRSSLTFFIFYVS